MKVENSWVEVSKSALLHNISQFRKVIDKDISLAAVVKSNAYGHGLELVSKAISSKVDFLCTVNLLEAVKLRRAGIKKPILVLSFYFSDITEAIRNNVSLVIYRADQIKKISKAASRLGKQAQVHLKVETGIGRLGIENNQALKLAQQVVNEKNIQLQGVFSHFAASEENQKYTQLQINKFDEFLKTLKQEKIKPKNIHFASSAASLVNYKTHYNMIRMGIGLYGLWPSELTKRLALKKNNTLSFKPVLTWKTKVILTKELSKGTSVGYGCTYQVNKKTTIAVLPVGYYDGYARGLSRKGEVIIKGKRCKVLGRIAMNLTVVDVTRLVNVKSGDEVILINDIITTESVAKKISTINYEIVTRINPLISRILVK